MICLGARRPARAGPRGRARRAAPCGARPRSGRRSPGTRSPSVLKQCGQLVTIFVTPRLVERRRRSARRLRLERVLVRPSGAPGRRCSSRAGRGSRRRARPAAAGARRRARGRPRALVEGGGAADPVEDLGRGVARLEHAHVEPVRPEARSACGLPHGFCDRSTSRSIVAASAGNRASTITRWRRRSTMWSTCSIETGHSWTQAPQVTQSQTTSSVTASGTSGRRLAAGEQPRGLPRRAGRGGP